ncbi:uncharacterized protein LOC131078568 isoform X2 [Cryptomeria japonica]|uniref:uncharacterized protein LOC131078568 isoform X2 n=1 Tax=Cryptomeria japonica TaxID=3369 RepID=UPI0027D9E63A|nr:uncharacterized protein LOC131078568 isoform X2 [Cryptomeria japonica]
MDYFTLNRRELQALCKKHAIPANLTNVSMAEALTALLNKQQAKSEDTGDKSVLTDISNTPRKCTRSEKHEVAAEGKSAEEPIVLDDDEAPSALKEKHVKSAVKTLKGKCGDQTEKSRSKIRQRKILDKDVDESSVTPYTSVKAGRGRTCKRGTNEKNPSMRGCNAIDTEDAKPVQQKHDSCKNEEESDEANNVTETRPKPSRKKVDKMEMATEEINQVLTHTEDAKALLQEQESCERGGGTIEVVPKTRSKRGLLRKKVDKVEMATEERIQESFDANDQSVEVVLKTGTKARPSRNRVDKLEEATEESIQGTNNDGPFKEVHETRHKSIRKKFDAVKEAAEDNIDGSTGANHNIEEDTRESTGTDDANDESVKVFSDIRFKGRSSRKKVDEVGKATGESKGTNDVNYESVEEISRTGPKGKLSRKKIEEATKESIKWTDDMNDEEISRTKWVSSSRKRSEKVAEENIQGVHDESKGDQNPICRRSTRALSRSKYSGVDSVKETPGASKRIKISSDKKVEYDPAETSVKVSAKKHAKSPVHTRRALRALSTKNDSPKLLDGDAMEDSASKGSKQMSICTQTNQIQISYDSADVKNGGESNSDLDCSKIKQGRVGHRRTAKKAAIKSHHKELDLLEADLAQETIEDEICLKGMNITESYSGQPEPETKRNNLEVHENPAFSYGIDSRNAQTGEALCIVVKEIQGKTVQNGVVIAGPGRIQPQPMHLISKADDDATFPYGIKSKFLCQGEYMHVGVSIAESPNETELKTMCSQEGKAPGFKDEEGHAEFMKEGVSISESSNGTDTETICAQEGKIKDEESQGVSIQKGVSKAESPNRTKPEIMCAQEGEAPGIKAEEGHAESMKEGVSISESSNGIETETICSQEGKIKDEESQGVSIQKGVSKAESPNRTKPEIMCAQEGEAPGIKDEVSQEETVQKDVGKAESPNGTKPETICAREGEIKDEESQGVFMQEGVSKAESPNRIKPEIMCAQEGEAPGIKDEVSQEETVQKDVGKAESPNGTKPETMCAQEGKAPGIKDEESQGESMQDGLSIAESPNETKPETMCAQEGKAPGIKDEESQGASMQDGLSIAESPNGVEPETLCAQESGSPGIKDEESQTTLTMMVDQEIVVGEPGTVAGPTEKDCLHTEAVGSDDLTCVVEKPSELQQCTANLGDETIDNIMEDVYKEIRSDIGTEEDPGAKNSEDLVLSVMPNILELPKREGQDKNVPSEVHNNELCSHEVHVSFCEIRRQSLVQNSPVTLLVKTEDGATEGKVPTGLEDEDDIQAHFSNNVSEAVTSISIGNAKADLVERLAYLSIDNDNQTDVIRVTSSSVQVDNEAKDEKRMESSSVQIDSEDQMKRELQTSPVMMKQLLDGKKELHSVCICTVEERIKDLTSHDETGSNNSPFAKELTHFKAKGFVQNTVKAEKQNGFNDETGSRKEFFPSTPTKEEQNILNTIDGETGSREEFVPSTPPKEEQSILNTIDDEQESSHVKLEILGLSNTDEETEVMESQEAFKTIGEVEDLGLSNTDEETEVMESQEAFKTIGEVEDLGLGNKNPLALQECEQHNTKELEETLCQAKAPLYMADTHFHEKTCGPDEQGQLTYVDKLQNEANNNVLLIEKKNFPPLTSLSLCKLRVMCKDKMAKVSTHFQEKPCSKDEVTCGNNLQNEIKKENYDHLSLRKLKAIYKEKKAGKRSALHNLSSNDLEEREKGPNKAELQITYGSQK